MAADESRDDRLAFLQFQGTNRINERASGLQPLGGAVQQLALKLSALGNGARPGAVEDFGMPAKGPRGRAGRIEQNRIELALRLPGERISCDEIGLQMRALKILAQPFEAACRGIGRRAW